MSTPIRLVVRRGGQIVDTRDFEGKTIRIGRLASAQLRLEDPGIARVHAVIEVGKQEIAVIDMGSVTGTRVRGERIQKAVLQSGDRIDLGEVELEILFGAELGASAPASGEAAGGDAPEETAAAAAKGDEPAPEEEAKPEKAAEKTREAAPVKPVETRQGSEAAPSAESKPTPSEKPSGPAPEKSAKASPSRAGEKASAPAAAPKSAPRRGTEPVPVARPIPWPREAGHRNLALNLRILWGDKALDTGSFRDEELVTIGGKQASFSLHPEGAEAEALPIAKQVDGEWVLHFPVGARGEVITEETVRPLEDLARPGSEVGHELALAKDAAAWVEWGGLRFEYCFRPVRRQVKTGFWQKLDQGFAQVFLVVAFLASFLLIGFENTEPPEPQGADELFANQARFTRLLLEPPEKRRQNPFLQRFQREQEERSQGSAARAAGEEGKAGKKDAPERQRRSAPRAIQPDDAESVRSQGILAALGKGGGGLATILGSSGLGGELTGAIGGIQGAVGDARGFGGLGLRGTGPGGGGEAQTVTVGALGTRGRGGGQADFGSGVGELQRKGQADVSIDDAGVAVTGTIDREVIRRVIRSHESRIRYCYENELQRQPNLSGRVAFRFLIGSNGKVTMAQVDSSTLRNANVENCIANRIRQMVFPAPKGGGSALVTYPWVFRAAGA